MQVRSPNSPSADAASTTCEQGPQTPARNSVAMAHRLPAEQGRRTVPYPTLNPVL